VEPAQPAPTPSATPNRTALLDHAMDLMDGSATYTADDLIALADYLAGEK
jgi:hypothetical protein